jgi:glycosyltransferase involved in cell wall biosynthesis
MQHKISVIITTYNRPQALKITIQSLAKQSILPDEVIIADDGSDISTFTLPTVPFPLKHVWHEDAGFQAATIRNKAAAQAKGDYFIFLDGDIAVFPNFILEHKKLAEKGWFVAGNRILINPKMTSEWENNNITPLTWSLLGWFKARAENKINRILPLLKIPVTSTWRKRKAKQWQGAKTCNLGVWKTDFLEVNGFDETYQGWGHEDADLAIRLIHKGVHHKDGRFVIPALHLWHPDNSRKNEQENWQRLQERVTDADFILAKQGVNQYL